MLKKNLSRNSKESMLQHPALTLINEGTFLKGSIEAQSDLRISGRVVGDSVSLAKVIVTKGGKVEGNVKGKEVDISGYVKGKIEATQCLLLRKKSFIDADILVASLIVEEGAVFNGNCTMSIDQEGKKIKREITKTTI